MSNVFLVDVEYVFKFIFLILIFYTFFYRLFEEDMKKTYSFTNTPQLHELKELHFTSWLQKHVSI